MTVSMGGTAPVIGASLFEPPPSGAAAGVAEAALAFAPVGAAATGPLNGSGGATAAVAPSGDQRINGVLSGVKWGAGSISYSDPNSAGDYQASHPENFTHFQHINAAQLRAAHATLSDTILTQPPGAYAYSVEGFTNLSINYAGAGSGAGTIRLANTDDPDTAYAYYPANTVYGGDVFFGASGRSPKAGNYHYYTVVHELGHALGLKHGHDADVYGALPSGTDSMEYSVMTYRSYVGADAQAVYNETWGYAQTFMMYDIAALQRMYGADFGHNGGNTVYTWNPASGAASVNGALAVAPGGNRIFQTIWDGNGTDTYDLSNYATDLRVDLRPGEHSTFSEVQLADLDIFGGHIARGNVFNALQVNGDARSLIENAAGGAGNDSITGNNAANLLQGGGGDDTIGGRNGSDTLGGGAGADWLTGESGADVLASGTGKDTLIGGGGGDTFDFNLVTESPAGTSCDQLRAGGGGSAFDAAGNAAGDWIDVSGIDPNAAAGGDQKFVFGGTGKGHLWCMDSGTTTRVLGNLDSDAAAEFRLDILDGGVLAAAYKALDFIL